MKNLVFKSVRAFIAMFALYSLIIFAGYYFLSWGEPTEMGLFLSRLMVLWCCLVTMALCFAEGVFDD